MEEIWKDVQGYGEYDNYYEVSNLGRIRSKDRTTVGKCGRRFPFKGQIIKPCLTRCGYHVLNLRFDGKKQGVLVHRVVVKAFLTPEEGKTQVNHIDGDKTNNKLSNLEWVNASENKLHAIRIGITKPKKGENSTFVKLKDEQVLKIRYEHKDLTQKEIGDLYGVSRATVYMIRKNKIWTHI